MKIYIVMRSSGEYSDRIESPICAYKNEEFARQHVEKLDTAYRINQINLGNIHNRVKNKKPKDFWEAYQEECKEHYRPCEGTDEDGDAWFYYETELKDW